MKQGVVLELATVGAVAALVWFLKWYLLGLQEPIGDSSYYLAMDSALEVILPWSFHIFDPTTRTACLAQ